MSVQVKGSGTIGGLDEGLVVSGIITSSTQLNVGSNIKLGSAGVCTATSFVGSGANLTSLPSQITFNNAAADRVLTSNGGTAVNAEANLTMTGNNLQFNTTANGHAVILKSTGNYYNKLSFDSGNTSAGGELTYIDFKWDGDKVADIQVLAGSDTTNKDDGHLVFRTSPQQGNIAERLRIASDGKITVAANSDIRFTNGTWTGEVAGKIQQNSNNLYIQGGTGGIRFRHASSGVNQFSMTNGGNFEITNGDLVVASGHGIDFSATANGSGTMENELLDDYEEGTWVPVYNNVNTPNYGHRSGRYTKIGRFVYLVCQISVDSGLDTSDGSTVNIGGLPFAGNSAHSSCLFQLGQYIDVMPDSTIDLFTNVRFNSTSVMLHEGRNNQDITYTQLNSSGNLQFACSYAL